jgi:hypothetical protein
MHWPLDRIVFFVDHAVPASHFKRGLGVEARKCIEGAVNHLDDEFPNVFQFAVAVCRAIGAGQSCRRVAELFGFITDALEVGDGLDDRHDEAQVGRCRRPRREDAAAILVDRHFHRVDLVVLPGHFLAEPAVPGHDSLDAVLQLLLDEAAICSTPVRMPSSSAL